MMARGNRGGAKTPHDPTARFEIDGVDFINRKQAVAVYRQDELQMTIYWEGLAEWVVRVLNAQNKEFKTRTEPSND